MNSGEFMRAEKGSWDRRLLSQAALLGVLSAVVQVLALRLCENGAFAYRGPFALSLVTGLAIFWLGIGSALAPALRKAGPWVAPLGALGTLAAGIAIPQVLDSTFKADDLSKHIVSVVLLLSLPMGGVGLAIGDLYDQAPMARPGVAARLTLVSTLGFALGFLLANPFLRIFGLAALLLAAALLLLLWSRPFVASLSLAAVVAVMQLSGLSVELEKPLLPKAMFWPRGEASEHQFLLGGWSPYARVDFYRDPLGCVAGLYNGFQQWMACPTAERDFNARRALYAEFSGEVLLIGAGGGQGVVSLTKANRVVAVELDPFVVSTMQGALADGNGRAYLTHETYAADARAWLERHDDVFDIVIVEGADFSLSSLPFSVTAFENGLYTREGVEQIFSHLRPEGIFLTFHSNHLLPVVRQLSALPEGVQVMAWKGEVISGTMRFPMYLTAASHSTEALERFIGFVDRTAPGMQRIDPVFRQEGFELRPSPAQALADVRPFLYVWDNSRIMPLSVVGLALLGLLAFMGARWKSTRNTVYFSAIGVGWLTLLLSFVALFRSALDGYSLTTAAIMASLALASALGALMSERIGRRSVAGLLFVGLFTALGATFLILGVESFALRALLLVGSCLLLGFPLGVFMPVGLRAASSHAALAYGVDAVGTALGFVLFTLAALSGGFYAALGLAVLAYLIALAAWPTTSGR